MTSGLDLKVYILYIFVDDRALKPCDGISLKSDLEDCPRSANESRNPDSKFKEAEGIYTIYTVQKSIWLLDNWLKEAIGRFNVIELQARIQLCTCDHSVISSHEKNIWKW